MPRDKKAHRQFGDVFGRWSRADFSSWEALKASPFVGWLGFILTCLIITLLMTFSFSNIPEKIVPGTIAEHDIRADRNYEVVDQDATNKFKEEATSGVLSIYDFDQDLGKKITERVVMAFTEVRSKILAGENVANLKPVFEASLEISLSNEEWNVIVQQNFSKQFETSVESNILTAMSRFIAIDTESIISEKSKGVTLRDSTGAERTLNAREIGNIFSLEDIRKKIKKESSIATVIAADMLQPNVSFNMQMTDARKKEATANVKSVVIKIEVGEVIVRVGSRYEQRHVTILNGIKAEKEKVATPLKTLGTFILVGLVILSSYYFAERFIKKFAPQKVDIYFMGAVLIFILAILRLSLAFSRGFHDSFGVDIPMSAFYYAIPVAGSAMLVRFILNSETAIIFSIITSIFAGVFVGGSIDYTTYYLISNVAAAAAIAYADKRSSIIRAGLYTSAINIVAATSIQLINAGSLTEPLTVVNMLWYITFAIIGGISCSIFVTLVTPVAESIFGYTTDIKLLELANLNHPLLRELVIRAPGTYHHSHLVGILAEAASEVTGANPLLARVAAYYHDIGKIRKPLYFVENTTDCESRHEKLSPHMSALIIASHVKDGIELAKEYKVPKKIMDMIPQHHGTKMIGFFYDKAVKQNDPSVEKLEDKDFRYQGPKPQTREAGILLLADAVEAAVRSLKEKSPTRIQQMVEDVINSSFTEAQLDECDLTLRNLHDIAKSFTKILMGIYHQRIEYPKEALKNGN